MADIRQISPELAIKARIELNEVEKRIPEDIAALRIWISKQPHLKTRTSDQFLVTFLRGCKYSLEKAKQKIDYFYTFRSISPDIFLNSKITEKSIKLIKIGPLVPLPKPLKSDGPCIIFSRFAGTDPAEFSFLDHFKNQIRILNILALENDNFVIGGIVNVVDMANASLDWIVRFDPVLGKKMSSFSEKAMPFRVIGFHFINIPTEALAFLKIIHFLMPKKIKERMMVHSSLGSLYEHVPQEYLPEEYGGNNGRIGDSIEFLEELMIKYTNYFEEDDQYKTNEELRIGTKVNSESLFGLEGSFRKLEVD